MGGSIKDPGPDQGTAEQEVLRAFKARDLHECLSISGLAYVYTCICVRDMLECS